MKVNRVILIVLDSLGIGAAPDAARFGDEGANTLGNIGTWCEKNFKEFSLPHLSDWGLGRLCWAYGLKKNNSKASFGAMQELSPGKDTTTGHWELAGSVLEKEFPVFSEGFSAQLLSQWCLENRLPGFLGNKAASGTTIIQELGVEHIKTGKPIVYTSGDSVFQVACSEESFGLERLYEVCRSARKLLDPLGVGRIIARPFVGQSPENFKRTENRRDYSMPPPFPNALDVLVENNMFVAGVGKIEDIFAHRAVTLVDHTGRNETSLEATLKMMQKTRQQSGLIFTNLIDFDQHYGHRRDPMGYAKALMAFDDYLPKLESAMEPTDLMILTADHGNDPTFKGTDHTRENVPLLLYSKNPKFVPQDLGLLKGFHTVGRLVLDALGLQKEIAQVKTLNTATPIVLGESC